MDLRLTLISKSFAIQSEFYEAFSDFDQISIATDFPTQPDSNYTAALIVPCSNAFGLLDFGMTSVSKVLTIEHTSRIKQIIFDNHRGEQPVLSSILADGSALFPYICWTALGRVRSALSSDFAYSGLWSAFSAVHNHNMNERKKPGEKRKFINLIYLPDFSEYINSDAAEPILVKDFVRQMGLAIKAWILNESMDVPTLAHAEKRQKQITTVQVTSRQEIETTLMGLIYRLSGDIGSRGLCNLTELEIMINWVEENGKHTSICAETLAKLMKRPDTDFAIKRKVIIDAALRSKAVLSVILDMATTGTIQLHQEIKRSELISEKDSLLGQGTAGTVTIASWKDMRVAVKGFNGSDEKVAKEFSREISLLSLIQHNNIVLCHGAGTDTKDLFIVEELLLANLYEVLHDTNLPISHTMKLNFASGVASGMRHLHRCHLIHRDLKSLNVLVGTNLEVKICDFGLSRFCDKTSSATMTNNIGTVCWVAPEIFARKVYNEKADVYSFAIVLWEILTRCQPFSNIPTFSVPVLVMKGDRPPIPKDIPREWARLIQKCWGKKAGLRPGFEEICANIKSFKLDLASTMPHSKTAAEKLKTLCRNDKDGFAILLSDGSKNQHFSDSPYSSTKTGTGSWNTDPNMSSNMSSTYPNESSGSSQESPNNFTNPSRSDSLLNRSDSFSNRSDSWSPTTQRPISPLEEIDSDSDSFSLTHSTGIVNKKRLKVLPKESSSEDPSVSKARKRLNHQPSGETGNHPRRKESTSKGTLTRRVKKENLVEQIAEEKEASK